MEAKQSTALINQKAFSREDVLDYYEGLDNLLLTEEILFEKFRSEIEQASVFDLGVGGGRTTKHLLPMAKEYVGVDYVPEFVARATRRFPAAEFLVGDAREMTQLKDESFDFILFSYNGLDNLGHADRLNALREIYRVLRKGGVFMFSSHNRDYRYFGKPYWYRDRVWNAKLIKNLLSHLYFLPRRIRLRKHEVFTSEYAIINDSDHRYSLLMYYINIEHQFEQLLEAGFKIPEAFNEKGESTMGSSDESFWVYYTAQKS